MSFSIEKGSEHNLPLRDKARLFAQQARRKLRDMNAEAAESRAKSDPLARLGEITSRVDIGTHDPGGHVEVVRVEKPPVQSRLPGTSPLYDFEKGQNI